MNRTVTRTAGGAIAAALAVSAAIIAPSPAQAAVIKCKTAVTYNRTTKKTTARVVSLNRTGTKAAVHSAIFVFSDGDGLWTRTLDKRTNKGKGYGPSITVNGYAFQATMWQAGTRCATGGVTSAG